MVRHGHWRVCGTLRLAKLLLLSVESRINYEAFYNVLVMENDDCSGSVRLFPGSHHLTDGPQPSVTITDLRGNSDQPDFGPVSWQHLLGHCMSPG